METATRGRKKRRRRDGCPRHSMDSGQLYSVVTSTLVCDSNYTALCRVRNWSKGTSHRHRFMRTRKGNRSSSFGEDEICVNEFRPGCEVRIGTPPRARSGCSVSILRRTKAFSVIGRARARSRPDELAYSPLAYSHEYAAQSRPCGAGPEILTTRILPGSAALLVRSVA
jgi:hypothetical protein